MYIKFYILYEYIFLYKIMEIRKYLKCLYSIRKYERKQIYGKCFACAYRKLFNISSI